MLTQHQLLAPLALGLATVVGYVTTVEPPADLVVPALEQPPASTQGKPSISALPAVTTLYSADTDAYGVHLFPHADGVVLATEDQLTLLQPGEPPQTRRVQLGPVAARQGDDLVFWRSGKLRKVSLSLASEKERDLVPLGRMPLFLLASDARVAWVDRDEQGSYSVQTLATLGKASVYRTQERIIACTLVDDTVFAISSTSPGHWKVAAVPLDGRAPTFTTERSSRPPSMLAVGKDGLYLYAGPLQGVLRLSFDLEREDSVMPGEICSPIAVSDRVLCARVGGLVELLPSVTTPRPLASEPTGPIANLVADDNHAYWITDTGTRGLALRSLALSEL